MTSTPIDLTGFGFTPTESLVYQALLEHGPGTGYAIARNAGLARANAYSALEGLVSKGAANTEGSRPKRYRPEPGRTLVARLAARQSEELDGLTAALERFSTTDSPSLVEINSARSALKLISHDLGRAETGVKLLAPADAYPILSPVIRRAASAGLELALWSVGTSDLSFVPVAEISPDYDWPGMPLISVVDGTRAVIAHRSSASVAGHWGTSPAFVAAARSAIDHLSAR